MRRAHGAGVTSVAWQQCCTNTLASFNSIAFSIRIVYLDRRWEWYISCTTIFKRYLKKVHGGRDGSCREMSDCRRRAVLTAPS